MSPKLSISMLLTVLALVGCGPTPAEQLALKHAEKQSQINSRNFDRATQMREEKEEQRDENADGLDKISNDKGNGASEEMQPRP